MMKKLRRSDVVGDCPPGQIRSDGQGRTADSTFPRTNQGKTLIVQVILQVGAPGFEGLQDSPGNSEISDLRAAIGAAPPADPDFAEVARAWRRLTVEQRGRILKIAKER
jgi:hypothetical protein